MLHPNSEKEYIQREKNAFLIPIKSSQKVGKISTWLFVQTPMKRACASCKTVAIPFSKNNITKKKLLKRINSHHLKWSEVSVT